MLGKNEVILSLKKEFRDTSIIDIKNKKAPIYKYLIKFLLSGFTPHNSERIELSIKKRIKFIIIFIFL
tara:strand:+ start:42 stop:245 length:204 start_codon:yes stop_codon:yes gene_type:complete